MEKTIYFVRHGQTDYNLNHIVQGSGINSSLNATGRSQARAFYQYYQNVPFDLVITSALQRTAQTMQPFIDIPIPHYEDPNINEINWGEHEGMKFNPKMGDTYKNLIKNWSENKLDAAVPNGESARALLTRCTTFLDKVKVLEGKNILVCTHGRTLRSLMTLVNGEHPREMEKYEHHNTGLFLTKWNGQKFNTLKVNDTTHLKRLNGLSQ